jgi:hypothetical protein
MSEPARPPANSGDGKPPTEPVRQGPSLTLFYGLLALALALAIGFALLIVLPFYHRR